MWFSKNCSQHICLGRLVYLQPYSKCHTINTLQNCSNKANSKIFDSIIHFAKLLEQSQFHFVAYQVWVFYIIHSRHYLCFQCCRSFLSLHVSNEWICLLNDGKWEKFFIRCDSMMSFNSHHYARTCILIQRKNWIMVNVVYFNNIKP